MPEIFHPYASFGHQSRMPMRFEADVFECEVEGAIPPELQGELEGIRQAIIAGELVVESPSTP